MSEFFVTITCEDKDEFSIIIEDDGKVAYAYLLENNVLTGDVWLYNQAKTPQEIEWDETHMPFLNPVDFVDDKRTILPIKDISEVRLNWKFNNDCELIEVFVFIREALVAVLRPHALPGWSLYVKADGPLARKYDFI